MYSDVRMHVEFFDYLRFRHPLIPSLVNRRLARVDVATTPGAFIEDTNRVVPRATLDHDHAPSHARLYTIIQDTDATGFSRSGALS